MAVSAAGFSAQEAFYGDCPVHEPGASPTTILPSSGGHGASSGRAEPGHSLAPVGALSRGSAVSPAAVSAAAARWPRRSAAPVRRGVAGAGGAAAHALAALVS